MDVTRIDLFLEQISLLGIHNKETANFIVILTFLNTFISIGSPAVNTVRKVGQSKYIEMKLFAQLIRPSQVQIQIS